MSAWALSDYHGDVVSNALAEGLHDKTAKVRAISAWGIGNIGSRKDVGEIEGVLSDSSDEVR